MSEELTVPLLLCVSDTVSVGDWEGVRDTEVHPEGEGEVEGVLRGVRVRVERGEEDRVRVTVPVLDREGVKVLEWEEVGQEVGEREGEGEDVEHRVVLRVCDGELVKEGELE